MAGAMALRPEEEKLFEGQPKGFPFGDFDLADVMLPEGEDMDIPSDAEEEEEEDVKTESGFGNVLGEPPPAAAAAARVPPPFVCTAAAAACAAAAGASIAGMQRAQTELGAASAADSRTAARSAADERWQQAAAVGA